MGYNAKSLILQNVFYPPLLIYALFDIWDYKLGHLFGEVGCGLYMFAGLFIIHHDLALSLFINICIPANIGASQCCLDLRLWQGYRNKWLVQ